jgi:hypothetical protein
MAIQGDRAAARANLARELAGGQLRKPGEELAGLPINLNLGRVNRDLPRYKTWQAAHDTATNVDKAVFNTSRVGGSVGRVAGGVLNNPLGQTALFMSPMFLMAGGESAPPESYQDAGMIVPAMMPPDSYQQMYSTDPGMPPTPQLDEEQIRRARKRAEEQAALQQFYAQALTQYQG